MPSLPVPLDERPPPVGFVVDVLPEEPDLLDELDLLVELEELGLLEEPPPEADELLLSENELFSSDSPPFDEKSPESSDELFVLPEELETPVL